MARAIAVGLPPFFTLENGYKVRVTAQNATTGATVTAVVASNVSISVDQEDNAAPAPLPSPVSGAYTSGLVT